MAENEKRDLQDATVVITGKTTRLAYANLFVPRRFGDGEPYYSADLIIPKDRKKMIARIKKAIQAAYELGKKQLQGEDGSIPGLKELSIPLRDGDKREDNDLNYQDALYIRARSEMVPVLLNENGQEVTSTKELYSGCYAQAEVWFKAYNHGENRGICAILLAVKKSAGGPRLGVRQASAEDFDVADEADEEEEDIL